MIPSLSAGHGTRKEPGNRIVEAEKPAFNCSHAKGGGNQGLCQRSQVEAGGRGHGNAARFHASPRALKIGRPAPGNEKRGPGKSPSADGRLRIRIQAVAIPNQRATGASSILSKRSSVSSTKGAPSGITSLRLPWPKGRPCTTGKSYSLT